jgi:hypothetical protein
VVWLTTWVLLKQLGIPAAWARTNPTGYAAVITMWYSIALVLPGLCTGLISGRDGIRLGALAGLIGSLTFSTLFPLLRLHPTQMRMLMSQPLLVIYATAAVGLMITCAAGGGAGELLRSNNRWSGRGA